MPVLSHAAEQAPVRIDRYLLFGGVDLWRGGFSLHGGLVLAPAGLGQSGFTMKILTGGGLYRYRANNVPVTGLYGLNAVMPGWHIAAGTVNIDVFAGVDIQNHRLTPDDPGNTLRGTRTGLRTGLDVWAEPAAGFMTAGSLWISTIGHGYWSRAAFGWRMWDRVWLGPEIHMLGDTTYRQWRAGLHATGLRTGPLEWSAGVGYAFDSDDAGAYGRIGILMRR